MTQYFKTPTYIHPLKHIEICVSLKAYCNCNFYSIELKFSAHITGIWDYLGNKFGDHLMSSGNDRAKIRSTRHPLKHTEIYISLKTDCECNFYSIRLKFLTHIEDT